MPPLKWRNQFAVCIVMTSRGYPLKYPTGHLIRGLESDFGPDVMVFHSGTKQDSQNQLRTNGGRVLGITALGDTIAKATNTAYSAVHRISWGEKNEYCHYYRTDIAKKHSNDEKPASLFL
jgi:phosphoribosylamine--glycine ligase